MTSTLTGTGTLIRFILRRDRIRLPVWIVSVTLFTVSSTNSITTTYPDQAARQARAELMESPAAKAFSGPGYGRDNYTYGAMLTNEVLPYLAIVVALMSLLLVVRHTRAEEQTGRAELVRAAVVGRHAAITAALVVVGCANLLAGALIAVSFGASGIESLTWSGSLLFGAAIAMVGLVFTAVAAFTAQVSEYSRGASGLAGAVLGVTYALRAAGDLGNGVLSWLSPIGWTQATRAYTGDQWWPLALAVPLIAVLVYGTFAVASRRDVGAGVVRPRPGPPHASRLLSTPFGLSFRLQRAALLWWSLGLLMLGAVYGSLVSDVIDVINENEAVREVLLRTPGANPADSYLAVIISMLALLGSVFAVLAAQRPRTEETSGRAEPVLATAVSRLRWLGAQLAVALLGGALLLLASGLGLGVAAALTASDASLLPEILGGCLAYLSAVAVSVTAGVFVFGFFPKFIAAVWAVLGYALVVGVLGGLLNVPGWMYNLSPYEHLPRLPAEDFRLAPVLVLSAIAVGLALLGFVGFRRRDLHSN